MSDRRSLAVVQFVHPGFEYPLREPSGVMDWKAGNSKHDRKFLLSIGSVIDFDSGTRRADVPIAFWGEWEGPSVHWRVESSGQPLPRVVHAPFRPAEWPAHPVQNTDPLVFGPAVIYSNCLQNVYASLQNLEPGSIILFGRHSHPKRVPAFSLDTCLVVEDRELLGPSGSEDALGQNLLRDAVLHPLHTEGARDPLTIYYGARPDGSRPFSFFPARPVQDKPPLFARPDLSPVGPLEGVVSPANMQGIKLSRVSAADRDVIWQEVARQTARQGCALGFHAAAPPVVSSNAATRFAEGRPRVMQQPRAV
jgi:hypothetical protein